VRPLDGAVLTTWNTPPDTAVSESCQNSGQKPPPIGKGLASRHIRRGLIALLAHIYLAYLPTLGKMIKSIA
jgi:hypothetical protein